MKLLKVAADVTNVNPRKQNHGPDLVPASDMNLKVMAPPDALDEYIPGLSAFLFTDEGPRNQSVKTSVRSPLEPFSVTFVDCSQGDLFGGAFEPFTVHGVKIKIKDIEPIASEEIRLTLQLQMQPEPEKFGVLDMMIKETVVLSIESQAVEEQKEAA